MRFSRLITVALAAAFLVGCGDAAGPGAPADDSGVVGVVHLGPQCPVQSAEHPCPDTVPAGVEVTLARPLPGDSAAAGKVIARGTTDADGSFRLDVAPGHYVLTSDAGMSCGLVDARVTDGAYATVDVTCDTGIR